MALSRADMYKLESDSQLPDGLPKQTTRKDDDAYSVVVVIHLDIPTYCLKTVEIYALFLLFQRI